MMSRTWDIGDAEPTDIYVVFDDFGEDWGDNSPRWARTFTPGEWKGYKGGKTYMDWDDLVRRFGPVREEQ